MKRYLLAIVLLSSIFSCSSEEDPDPKAQEEATQAALDLEAETNRALLLGSWKVTEFLKYEGSVGGDVSYNLNECYEPTALHAIINATFIFKESGIAEATPTCGDLTPINYEWTVARGMEPGLFVTKESKLFLKNGMSWAMAFMTIEVVNNNKIYLKQYDLGGDTKVQAFETVTIERM